jgi:hypothetical protein
MSRFKELVEQVKVLERRLEAHRKGNVDSYFEILNDIDTLKKDLKNIIESRLSELKECTVCGCLINESNSYNVYIDDPDNNIHEHKCYCKLHRPKK